MSKIEKLSISGIRNFSPLVGKNGIIEFNSSLTLIIGQNGCGKTTIIEALKFITTGDVPPGCGRNGNFIHDKLLGDKERMVKAQVKLGLTDTKGQEYIVARSMEATHQAKRISVNTFDGLISHIREDGTRVDLSGKCADFESYVPSLLGVTKPILKHVIFCHQEESNWPLDESKKVKEKFDAIFSATHYIKCLDNIKKLRVQMKADNRTSEEVLKFHLERKLQANKMKDELNSNKAQIEEFDEQTKEFKVKKIPIKDKLQKTFKDESSWSELQQNKGGKEMNLKLLLKSQEELRSMQTKPVECSDEELFDQILNFDRQLSEKEDMVKRCEANVKRLEREIERYNVEKSKEVEKMGNLKAQHDVYLNTIQDQNKGLTKIANQFNFDKFKKNTSFTTIEGEEILSMLKDEFDEKQSNIEMAKAMYKQDQDEIQTTINQIKIKLGTLDKELENYSTSERELRNEVKQLEKNIRQTSSMVSLVRIEDLESDIEKVQIDIKIKTAELDPNKTNEEIEELEREQMRNSRELTNVKNIINKMNREINARTQYENKQKDLLECQKKVKQLKSKCSEQLEHLFEDGIPEDNLQQELNRYSAELQNQLQEHRTKENKLNRRKTELETKKHSQEKELKKKTDESNALEQKIKNLTEGLPLEDVLNKSKTVIEEKGSYEATLSSSVTILNGYVEKLRQKSCCPLCHQDFENQSSKEELIDELKNKVRNIPNKLQTLKKELKEQQIRYDNLIELKPQREMLNILIRDRDQLRNSIDSFQEEIRTVNGLLDETIEMKNICLQNEEMVDFIKPDVGVIDSTVRSIRNIQIEIDQLKATLGDSQETMTREEALTEEAKLESNGTSLSSQIKNKQKELQMYNQTLQELKGKEIEMQQKILDVKNKMQALENLKSEKATKEASIVEMKDKWQKAKLELGPLQTEKNKKEMERNAAIKSQENWEKTEMIELEKIKDLQKNAEIRHRNILSYVNSGSEDTLERTSKRVDSLQETIENTNNSKKKEDQQIKRIQEELSIQHKEKGNLDAEKRYREQQLDVIKVTKELEELQEYIKKYNIDALSDERAKLEADLGRINYAITRIEGQKEEKNARIASLEKELSAEVYRDADKTYKAKLIQIKCTEIALEDLNKYYKALDTSIMKFHSEKMTTINRILAELWTNTYKGNDITYIQIRTDETESQGADKRRNYNYRVVMKKHGKEMDMRGRCSAGQKVLASLIIRIALAETFSANCGILALDEPTTNLDKDNIEALAEALVCIVKRRSKQKNFQLILITHNEEFMMSISNAKFMDYYFRLQRTDTGCSHIVKYNVD